MLITSFHPDGFHHDSAKAEKVIRFFEERLVHVKGRKWAGEKFKLLEWERLAIWEIFGWVNDAGFRQYKLAYIEVPKKNGKSSMAAGIALFLLSEDGEHGAEVYSAASDRGQAGIVFDLAKAMADSSTYLSRRLRPFRNKILHDKSHSSYQALSADSKTKHGFNVSGLIFDELHTQPNRELWDTLTTGGAAREQPLTVAITTAGEGTESICREQHDYAHKVATGQVEDSSFFGMIYGADLEDDWTDPAIWAKANPSLGVTIQPEYLEQECLRAKASPAYQNAFRRLHLNQWTQQRSRFLSLDRWDRCKGELDYEELVAACKGRRAYGGLDLSARTDLTAFALLFPPKNEGDPFDLLAWHWLPEESVKAFGEKCVVPALKWAEDGWLSTTPGDVNDLEHVRQKIALLAKEFQIDEIVFDRYGALWLYPQLEADGFTMIAMGQGYLSMTAPTKELEAVVLEARLRHGGNPLLRWEADCLEVHSDPAGNFKPAKPDRKKHKTRIDGMVALIMALDRATRLQPQLQHSVYAERGILSL